MMVYTMIMIARSNLITLDQTLATARVFHQHLMVVIVITLPSGLLPCSPIPLPEDQPRASNAHIRVVVLVNTCDSFTCVVVILA